MKSTPLMDRNNAEQMDFSPPSEKKKYRARGCRGGSKNKKRVDKINHTTELSAVQDSLSSLKIRLEEVVDCYDSRLLPQQALGTKISESESVNTGYVNILEPFHHCEHSGESVNTIASTFSIPTPPTQKLPSIAETETTVPVSNIPKDMRSISSNKSGTSEPTVSVYDYYTKISNDPNISFDSINKLNQGYSSASISSSLLSRDSRFPREGVPPTANANVSSSHAHAFATNDGSNKMESASNRNFNVSITATSIDASPIHVGNSKHHLHSFYTPSCPSTPNPYSLSGPPPGFQHVHSSSVKTEPSIEVTRLALTDKLFDPSRHLFPPSLCDTSASSSSLSSKVTLSIHDKPISHYHASDSTLSSYPLMNSEDHGASHLISHIPSNMHPSESTPHSSLHSTFEQEFVQSNSSYSSFPLYDTPLIPSLHPMAPTYSDPIPRKITTNVSSNNSKTLDDLYSHCLNQTRSNIPYTERGRILPSWSIESDDRTNIKTIGTKKMVDKVAPAKVPLRLSALPPMMSSSYSTLLRDNQYGNQAPPPSSTHSTTASRSNQYTGALETFYRSFLPFQDQSDLLCNNTVWSEPKDDTHSEESFFNLSPHLFLHGIPKENKDAGRR